MNVVFYCENNKQGLRIGMNARQRERSSLNRGIPRVALLIESSRTYGRGILRGIAQYARVHGPWSFFVVERELQSGVPEALKTWHGDGIIARIENRRMAERLRELRCPVVDVLGQDRFDAIPSFDTDAGAVAGLAVEFFVRAGFRQFAYIGYPGIPFSDDRMNAFKREVERHGFTMNTLPGRKVKQSHIQATERAGIASQQEMARWLCGQPHPLAVMACNDVCAQQALSACRENGIRVPEEVAVIGVDNDDVLCNLSDPPLSSIEPDTERIGSEAAAMLQSMMTGSKPARVRTLIPPVRLVERASTDVVAIEDSITVTAMRYIRDHVGEGIAVKDVAAHVGRSRSDLEKRFRQWLKTSVRGEILRRRMDRVSRLLRETDLGLDSVASKAGFATAAHLCRLFQRAHGQTPTQYRRSFYKNRQ